MHAVIGAADAMDEPLIVLLGHPEYYPAIRLRSGRADGNHPPEEDWEAAFMARPLTTYDPTLTGEFR